MVVDGQEQQVAGQGLDAEVEVAVDGQEQRVDHGAEVVVAGQGLDVVAGVHHNPDCHDTQMAQGLDA